MTPHCAAVFANSGLVCTNPIGHEGPHEARGLPEQEPFVVWNER